MTCEIKINIGPVASVFQPKPTSLIRRKLGPTASENDPEFWPGDFRYGWPAILRNDWPAEVRFRHGLVIIITNGDQRSNFATF